MKVLVTGGTGFVGAHTVAALIREGHDVRLLVRSRERVEPALQPLGVPVPLEIVEGDVTNAAHVSDAVRGCEAIVPAASVYSLDPRQARLIQETNVAGTENVLRAGVAAGADPILHVSSYAALTPGEGHLEPDSPPGSKLGAYGQSKAEPERAARRFQGEGAPVVTVMPGGVWGPHDPHFGESHQIAVNFLKARQRMVNSKGGFCIVDVRDVADGIAQAVKPGRGPRRYLMAGHVVATRDLPSLLGEATGRKLRALAVPPALVRSGGPFVDALQRVIPARLPLSGEMLRIATLPLKSADDSRTFEELGVTWRPLQETLRATVASLYATGRISAREAGRLADG